MSIPKIIHQTAKNFESLSWEEKKLIKRLRSLLPDWKYCFHDDKDNEKMIQEFFPRFYDKFINIKKGVVKADIARVMYMYCWGGMYLDTDCKLLKPIDNFILEKQCILPKSRTNRLGNAIFFSEPNLSIWLDFLEEIFSNSNLYQLSNVKINNSTEIENVTGPIGFTNFYYSNIDKYNYCYLPDRDLFHPKLSKYTLIFPKLLLKDSYTQHLCWASWRNLNIISRIKNILYRKIGAVR